MTGTPEDGKDFSRYIYIYGRKREKKRIKKNIFRDEVMKTMKMNKMLTAATFLATSLLCALAPVASYILCHQGVRYRPHMSLCRFTNAEPGHRPAKSAR